MRLVLGLDNDTDDDLVLYQGGANRVQLTDSQIYLMAKTGYGGCPSNYTLGQNICYRRLTTEKTWPESQYYCHGEGGHVCTYAEAYAIWGSSSCSGVHSDDDWLGDLVSDDYPLRVNDRCNKTNFENDDDSKTDSKPFVCCMNIR